MNDLENFGREYRNPFLDVNGLNYLITAQKFEFDTWTFLPESFVNVKNEFHNNVNYLRSSQPFWSMNQIEYKLRIWLNDKIFLVMFTIKLFSEYC